MKKWAVLGAFLILPARAEPAPNIDMAKASDSFADACRDFEKIGRVGGDFQAVFNGGYCVGYVGGLIAAGGVRGACWPEKGLGFYDAGLIINAFIDKNPVYRTRKASEAVSAALLDAFPCPAK